MCVLLALPVQVTEHGMGMYLLGSKGPLVGVVPSPGWYFQNDLYYYRARAGAVTKLPMGGKIGVGIRARALIDVPTLIWSPDTKILNAQPAFSLSQPIGRETVDADVVLGPQRGSYLGRFTTMGDPIGRDILAGST